jgi:hypothetical protein
VDEVQVLVDAQMGSIGQGYYSSLNDTLLPPSASSGILGGCMCCSAKGVAVTIEGPGTPKHHRTEDFREVLGITDAWALTIPANL